MRKNIVIAAFAAVSSALLLSAPTVSAQSEKVPTNKYSMKLKENPDGSYELLNAKKYAQILDLSSVEDLLVPFTLERQRLNSRDYKGVETKDIVYKKHNGYELIISVDMAVSEAPAPVMFYCHGGGWARGNNGALRTQSQYLAKQKGITGVRIQYTLAPQEGATVEVSMQDVLDAVEYVQDHAKELNIDPHRIGFMGTSAGAHLAATAAMRCKDAKLFVGYSGIYDLATAKITTKAKDPQRIAYFNNLDEKSLKAASPVNMIDKKHKMAVQLFCGTGDITVEYFQSEEFAKKLQAVKGNKVDLQIYKNYDHNLSSNSSDKMEEIFFKTIDFISENL